MTDSDEYLSKETYDFEMERKESIYNSTILPINTLVGLFISCLYIIDKVGEKSVNFVNTLANLNVVNISLIYVKLLYILKRV